MQLLQTLRSVFARPDTPADPDVTITRDTIAGIVAAQTHGNVGIQSRHYNTREQVVAEYRALQGTDLTA